MAKPTEMRGKILAVFGPTSSGKTSLSVKLSKYIWGQHRVESEMISIDSRQVYREMNIGTNKTPLDIRERYEHHFVDIVDVSREFTIDVFVEAAIPLLDEIWGRGRLPMLVGGTGTYLMSLIGDRELRDVLVLVPHFSRRGLYEKIEKNVDRMFSQGLYGEVLGLHLRYSDTDVLRKTLGYREFFEYCDRYDVELERLSQRDQHKIASKIKKNTKKYAMHQMSWLKKIPEYSWVRDWEETKEQVSRFVAGDAR